MKTAPAVAPMPAAAALPDPKTPAEFFARARQLSDLEASGIPFHLKATYVASGDTEFTGNGTYEEWWQSKNLWRKEATLGDYKYVEIRNGDKRTVYGTRPYVPLRLRQMLDAVLIRILPDSGSKPDWKLDHTALNGVDLVMASVERPCSPRMRCRTEDYFMPQGLFRIHLADSKEKLYNGFEEFQGKEIPRSIVLSGGKGDLLTISIGSVDPLSASDGALLKDASPPANLPAIVTCGDDPKDTSVTAAKILYDTQPVYPAFAKQHGIQGAVVIEATIDQEGKVREPYVIGSADPLLNQAALDAVRKWRYKPATVDGVPVCVSTRITVIFGWQR